jgi:hypothetical protein
VNPDGRAAHPLGFGFAKGAVFDSSCTRVVFQGFRFPLLSHINRSTLDIFSSSNFQRPTSKSLHFQHLPASFE